MNNDIKVRTSEAHKFHMSRRTTLLWAACGCATRENVESGTEITRCICGCAYLTKIVQTVIPFTCYDCMRAVHA